MNKATLRCDYQTDTQYCAREYGHTGQYCLYLKLMADSQKESAQSDWLAEHDAALISATRQKALADALEAVDEAHARNISAENWYSRVRNCVAAMFEKRQS